MIANTVLVLPDPAPSQIGLIVVPETVLDDNPNFLPESGRVVRLGSGNRDEDGAPVAFNVREGERVHFNRYAGRPLKWEGVDYLVMRESEITGVLLTEGPVLHGYQAATESEIQSFDHDPLADKV